MIIGITGSFGSGKTTVANMFKKYGFKVTNVDKLYHGIYSKDKSLKNKIKKEFSTLDRNKIKNIVFNDSKRLIKLNKITHPIIIKEIKKEISAIIKKYAQKSRIFGTNSVGSKKNTTINKNNNKKLKNGNKINVKVVVDVPLLFEAKIQNMFDKIIVVKCNKKEQIKRILKKKKYSKIDINQIIKSQMPLKEKIKKADFVVDNGKTLNETKTQVKTIISSL